MTDRLLRITVEQRCLAAQALWVAAYRMLDAGDPRAVEWYNKLGLDDMRYRCRCRYTIEAYYDAREMTPAELWSVPEDFAHMFLVTCVSKHSMNLNREWKTYLLKAIEREQI